MPSDTENSYDRAVKFAAAANLYLELGETNVAKQATEKAGTVDFDKNMLRELHDSSTQMLVVVLVRVGNINGGRQIAEKLQKIAPPVDADAAWLAWATACAIEGKTASVERQLEKTKDARTNAVLCAGVAAGLLELQQRPAGKKP